MSIRGLQTLCKRLTLAVCGTGRDGCQMSSYGSPIVADNRAIQKVIRGE